MELKNVASHNMGIGDKIKLKTDVGPEGSKNIGVIKKVKETGVIADFGLSYFYLIPFNSIKKHLRLERIDSSVTTEILKEEKTTKQLKL